MTIAGYLEEHYGLLILLLGLFIISISDAHLDRGIIRRIIISNFMLFVYSVTCYLEEYLGDQSYYSPLRPFLSAVCYSLIVFILIFIIMIVYPKRSIVFWIPAVTNSVLCFISLKTGIVFTISKDNHFSRGPLGYLTYITTGLYLFYFIYLFWHTRNVRHIEDFSIPVFMIFNSIICIIMPLYWDSMTRHWFNVTISIDIVFYYIYLLQQYTKRDPLTNLLNRQSYYSDADRFANTLTALVTMDMNGLKAINDMYGHAAGDIALKTITDCFLKTVNQNQRVYRIGGDEYVILCASTSEDEVKDLIKRINEGLKETTFSCSIGYAMKQEDSTLDSLYNSADKMMYEEKKLYYEQKGKDRRKR
ncbi:MAG: GGDEF domain-containing protein [Lachnospiraceae bacterium]|nr:GGDEF domain-containing protein [Lachnospiraceae bacterium]